MSDRSEPRLPLPDHDDCPSCGGGVSGIGYMIRHHEEWCEHRPPSIHSGGRDRDKETPIDGYEVDWISTKWRRMISSFGKAGRGKAIKTAMNKRARRRHRQEARDADILHDC